MPSLLVPILPGDHITFTSRAIAADRVVVGSAADHDAISAVAQTSVTSRVDTDVVTLDHVECATSAPDGDSVQAITRNYVPVSRC